jgi:hypothetical protein
MLEGEHEMIRKSQKDNTLVPYCHSASKYYSSTRAVCRFKGFRVLWFGSGELEYAKTSETNLEDK